MRDPDLPAEASDSSGSQRSRREKLFLRVSLERDTAFGRGSGEAGLVDLEIDHDRDGLPEIHGRTVKGLLNEECATLLASLADIHGEHSAAYGQWQAAAGRLFGTPGSGVTAASQLRYGKARLPASLRRAVRYELRYGQRQPALDRETVKASLTALRRQTALDATGAPRAGTLRTLRVLLRGTVLESELAYRAAGSESETARDLALLAACVKACRRGGTARNRGLGRLRVTLRNVDGDDLTDQYFAVFADALLSQENSS